MACQKFEKRAGTLHASADLPPPLPTAPSARWRALSSPGFAAAAAGRWALAGPLRPRGWHLSSGGFHIHVSIPRPSTRFFLSIYAYGGVTWQARLGPNHGLVPVDHLTPPSSMPVHPRRPQPELPATPGEGSPRTPVCWGAAFPRPTVSPTGVVFAGSAGAGAPAPAPSSAAPRRRRPPLRPTTPASTRSRSTPPIRAGSQRPPPSGCGGAPTALDLDAGRSPQHGLSGLRIRPGGRRPLLPGRGLRLPDRLREHGDPAQRRPGGDLERGRPHRGERRERPARRSADAVAALCRRHRRDLRQRRRRLDLVPARGRSAHAVRPAAPGPVAVARPLPAGPALRRHGRLGSRPRHQRRRPLADRRRDRPRRRRCPGAEVSPLAAGYPLRPAGPGAPHLPQHGRRPQLGAVRPRHHGARALRPRLRPGRRRRPLRRRRRGDREEHGRRRHLAGARRPGRLPSRPARPPDPARRRVRAQPQRRRRPHLGRRDPLRGLDHHGERGPPHPPLALDRPARPPHRLRPFLSAGRHPRLLLPGLPEPGRRRHLDPAPPAGRADRLRGRSQRFQGPLRHRSPRRSTASSAASTAARPGRSSSPACRPTPRSAPAPWRSTPPIPSCSSSAPATACCSAATAAGR